MKHIALMLSSQLVEPTPHRSWCDTQCIGCQPEWIKADKFLQVTGKWYLLEQISHNRHDFTLCQCVILIMISWLWYCTPNEIVERFRNCLTNSTELWRMGRRVHVTIIRHGADICSCSTSDTLFRRFIRISLIIPRLMSNPTEHFMKLNHTWLSWQWRNE